MKLIPLLALKVDFELDEQLFLWWFAPLAALITIGCFYYYKKKVILYVWGFSDKLSWIGFVMFWNILLATGVAVSVKEYVRQKSLQTVPVDEDKKQFEQRFSKFKFNQGKAIQDSIQELEILAEALKERISELEQSLKGLGRKPLEDEDFLDWKRHETELNDNLSLLNKMMEDAFIQHEKFRLTPTNGEEKEYEDKLDKGIQEALRVSKDFKDLTNKLRENNGTTAENNETKEGGDEAEEEIDD